MSKWTWLREGVEAAPITQNDLDQLENYADRLFAKVGIDVEFTRHFLDRVNDERNQRQITMAELTRLFKQEFKRWGKKIAQLGPDAEAVMKDMKTDVNMPFVLVWDANNQELDLIAKTVMRKDNFKTSNPEFTVEISNNVGHDDLLSMPQNTLVIDTPGELDWYKIGQHFPSLAQQDPKEFGQGESDMVITFLSDKEKELFKKIADKLGLKVKDIGGTAKHPEIHTEDAGAVADLAMRFSQFNPEEIKQLAIVLGVTIPVLKAMFYTVSGINKIKRAIKSIGKKKKPATERFTPMELAVMEGGFCLDEAAGVGIIDAQNTTADVKPGETQRQAAKFGIKLNKDNEPPLLHARATKNSQDTNKVAQMLGEADDPKDIIAMDVPLFVRILELSRETIKTDADLHHVVSKIIDLTKEQDAPLDMRSYQAIEYVLGKERVDEVLRKVKNPEGEMQWALVSKSDPKKVLQYYRGPKDQKPSDEWVKKVERRVHAFENVEQLYEFLDPYPNIKSAVRDLNMNIDEFMHILGRLSLTIKNEYGDDIPTSYEKPLQFLDGSINHLYNAIQHIKDNAIDDEVWESINEDIGKWETIRGVKYYMVTNKSGKTKAFSGPTTAAKKYAQSGGKYPWESINEMDCKYGSYYCSTDKKWKCRQTPKKKRTVSEVEQIDVKKDDLGISPDLFQDALDGSGAKLTGDTVKNYPVARGEHGNTIYYFLLDDNKPFGMLKLVGAKGRGKMSMAMMLPEYQGKGVMPGLYKIAIGDVGVIKSDVEQSAGGTAIWKRLAKDPELTVYAYDEKSDEYAMVDDNLDSKFSTVNRAQDVKDLHKQETDELAHLLDLQLSGEIDRAEYKRRVDQLRKDYEKEILDAQDPGSVYFVATMKESFAEDKMGAINIDSALKNTPEEWSSWIKTLPPQLAQEFIDERPNPDQEDVDVFTKLRLASDKPVKVSTKALLKEPWMKGSISRTPQPVVDAINKRWGTDFKGGTVYDRNPDRFFKYAKMSSATAKPSVMVDGDVIFGVGRMIAALLRGDDSVPVWNLKTSIGENFADGKKPGRKGLAKRVGVDCSKSVTALRKIAKNSSGEKQRMAHWCANMKSGRKKK